MSAVYGGTALDVRLERDTVWLSLYQRVVMFKRDKSVMSRHLRNVFKGVSWSARQLMQ